MVLGFYCTLIDKIVTTDNSEKQENFVARTFHCTDFPNVGRPSGRTISPPKCLCWLLLLLPRFDFVFSRRKCRVIGLSDARTFHCWDDFPKNKSSDVRKVRATEFSCNAIGRFFSRLVCISFFRLNRKTQGCISLKIQLPIFVVFGVQLQLHFFWCSLYPMWLIVSAPFTGRRMLVGGGGNFRGGAKMNAS